MALDTDTRQVLAAALSSDYIAKNLYDTINAAAGGAAAAGGSGAIQGSDGASGFVDSGIVAATGSITTGAWAGTAIAVAHGGTGSTTASGARTALGLGTAATSASTAFDAAGAAAAAAAASQPVSAKLTTLVAGAPVAVTGSKASGAALISLLAALVTLGLITDGTSS